MDYDWIVIGSGFGGSVSALRLTEKGYRVLLLEKGRRLGRADFPKTNWNLMRWLWMPAVGFRGLFCLTFLRHVTILSGVGVGGGSLVYANTLPIPKDDFFAAPSWAHLADWKRELASSYETARRMLGITRNPTTTFPDEVIRQVAEETGRGGAFQPTDVAVFFGDPDRTVPDPYFGGNGPDRTGCNLCGGCMLGCRVGAKNTLDQNYLYLAEQQGLVIEADTEATAVRTVPGGYRVEARQGASLLGRRSRAWTAENVVFAGGVLGTLGLLLRLKADPDGLPKLSDRLGDLVRTNSEALIGVVSERRDQDLSKGIAIGSIVQIGEHAHLEPVRYSAGSGSWRLLLLPHVSGRNVVVRVARLVATVVRRPLKVLRAVLVPDLARYTMIVLYMQTLEGTLRLRLGRSLMTGRKTIKTSLTGGVAPTASIPEATDLANRVADRIDGFPVSLLTETVLDIPTTAHILGGCCMGDSPETGVIDSRHRVFGYRGLYVIDGSAVSANPGVNPALTIAALAERAMGLLPPKGVPDPTG